MKTQDLESMAQSRSQLATCKEELAVLQKREARSMALASLSDELSYAFDLNEGGKAVFAWCVGSMEGIGYTAEEWQARGGWLSLVEDKDRHRVAEHFKEVSGGRRHEQLFSLRTPRGELRRVRSIAKGMQDPVTGQSVGIVGKLCRETSDGRPLYSVEMLDDVTALKRTEEKLKLTQYSVDLAADSIFWIGSDGRILFVNVAACRMLGYDAEALQEMLIHDIDPSSSSDLWPEHWEEVRRCQSVTQEGHYRTSKGRIFPAEITFNYVEYNGKAYQFAFARDITDRKRHEAELIRARREAEEMSQLRSAFLSNISHEVRTPLSSIIGFANILSNEVPERHRKFINFIERSGKRLLDSINSILNLSMLESGTIRLNREVINVSNEVQEKVQMMRPLAEEKGLSIETVMATSDVQVLLDRVCMDRILTNLLSNAIKFTDEGQVTVEVRSMKEHIEIRVADTGKGISQQFLPHLFDEFKQESSGASRSHEGIGLGLSITKRMVDLLGGHISVESEQRRGSLFIVTFPKVITPEKEPRELRLHEERPPERKASQKLRVLTLEDNADMLLLLKHYLGSVYEVVTASEEEDALRHARERPFDLVLMDINLGRDRTGVEVMKDLRLMDGYEKVPVVAVTAYALPGDRERFLEEGFDEYIGKPFTKQQLLKVLEGVLAK